MGGEDSEIRSDTTTVALECASFSPEERRWHRDEARAARVVRQRRRAAILLAAEPRPRADRTGAGDPAAARARRRAARRHRRPLPAAARTPSRSASRSRSSSVTSAWQVTRDEAVGALSGLGFAVTRGRRFARRHGRRSCAPTSRSRRTSSRRSRASSATTGFRPRVPDGPLPLVEAHPREEFRERLRDALVGMGLQETVSYSLIDPAWLERLSADGTRIAPCPLTIQNPTTPAQSAARPTLRASLLDTARRNLRHRDGVAIFEIAPVYLPRATRPARGTLDRCAPDRGSCARRELAWSRSALRPLGSEGDRRRHVREASRRRPGRSAAGRAGSSSRSLGAPRTGGASGSHLGAARPSSRRSLGAAGGDVPGRARRCRPARARVAAAGRLRRPVIRRRSAIWAWSSTRRRRTRPLAEAIRAAGKALVESVSLVDLYRGPQAGAGQEVVHRPAGPAVSREHVDRRRCSSAP